MVDLADKKKAWRNTHFDGKLFQDVKKGQLFSTNEQFLKQTDATFIPPERSQFTPEEGQSFLARIPRMSVAKGEAAALETKINLPGPKTDAKSLIGAWASRLFKPTQKAPEAKPVQSNVPKPK